jgi:hypothetical protein
MDSGGEDRSWRTGGEGLELLRSPAVTLVELPRISSGVQSCYLAAAASTTTSTRGLRLAIVDWGCTAFVRRCLFGPYRQPESSESRYIALRA